MLRSFKKLSDLLAFRPVLNRNPSIITYWRHHPLPPVFLSIIFFLYPIPPYYLTIRFLPMFTRLLAFPSW